MKRQNDGISESNILQNQFTAYFLKAAERRKIRYLQSRRGQQ